MLFFFTPYSFDKNLFEAIDTYMQLLPDDQVKEIDSRIADHLMVIKKEIWLKIREEVRLNTMKKHILGVYTKISKAILGRKLKIWLMRGDFLLSGTTTYAPKP